MLVIASFLVDRESSSKVLGNFEIFEIFVTRRKTWVCEKMWAERDDLLLVTNRTKQCVDEEIERGSETL